MLKVIVCKSDKQCYYNREDDSKRHRNIRWNNQQVREAIFIDSFNHILQRSSNWMTSIPSLSSTVSIF